VRRITALRRAGRASVAVELDGAAWRRLPVEVVVACGLRPGLELDRERFLRLRRELRRVEALDLAGRILRHRDVGVERLAEELARRGVAPAQRRQAIQTLESAGVVDDRRLAAVRASTLAGRGYGDRAIRWRLAESGLAEALVDEALAEAEPELDRARRIVDREGASPRTARLLERRGFDEDVVAALLPIADRG
jgi:SOS response regulatory protein OraA/RecX